MMIASIFYKYEEQLVGKNLRGARAAQKFILIHMARKPHPPTRFYQSGT